MLLKKVLDYFDTVEVVLSKRRGRGGLVQIMFFGMITILFDSNFIRNYGSI